MCYNCGQFISYLQKNKKLVASTRKVKSIYIEHVAIPFGTESHIPPLRERREDIPPLVWAFVKQNEKKLGKRVEHITRRSMAGLKRYDWPGNARELRNIIEHAMITSSGGTLDVRPPDRKEDEGSVGDMLEEVDRRHILNVLARTGWRITGKNGAAEILGLKRTTLQAKMKKLGIKRPSV
jgi:DNA-binding NtrC family response regulator